MERLKNKNLNYFNSGLKTKDKQAIIEKIERELLFNDKVVVVVCKREGGNISV